MRSRIYVMVALAGAVLSCTAQKSENRTPGHFNRIEVKGAIKVIFRQSDSTQVRVVADAEELQNIMTEAENGVLRISSKGNLEEAAWQCRVLSQSKTTLLNGSIESKE